MVGGNDRQLGAAAPGGHHWHRGGDAEAAGLIAGGSHHPSRAGTTDHDGAVAQRGVSPTLHLNEEGVHVDVKDRLGEHQAKLVGSAGH